VRSTRLRLPARRRTRRCAHTRSAENQPPPANTVATISVARHYAAAAVTFAGVYGAVWR
jgi:hypothetical protein